MDPRDFNFNMQSGLRAPGQNQGPVDWENAYSLMALAAFFMEKATLAAGRYVKASGRRNITGRDMILCLKYTALPSSNFWQSENLLQHCQEWRERLLAESSSEEEEEVEELTEEEENATVAEEARDPEHVATVDAAETAFESWEPADELGQAVHRAIRRAELSLLAQDL